MNSHCAFHHKIIRYSPFSDLNFFLNFLCCGVFIFLGTTQKSAAAVFLCDTSLHRDGALKNIATTTKKTVYKSDEENRKICYVDVCWKFSSRFFYNPNNEFICVLRRRFVYMVWCWYVIARMYIYFLIFLYLIIQSTWKLIKKEKKWFRYVPRWWRVEMKWKKWNSEKARESERERKVSRWERELLIFIWLCCVGKTQTQQW